MERRCSQPPIDKKAYISDIGKILIQDYGKKKFYKPDEVKKSHRKSKWYQHFDFSCWGMSVFSSHDDFDEYHKSTGEDCDYTEMKQEMMSGISTSDVDFVSLTEADVDASWMDFGALFEGIGDFFSSLDIGIDF